MQLSHNIVHTAQYHGLSLCYFYKRQASAGPVTFVATLRHRDHDNEASLPFWSELSSVFLASKHLFLPHARITSHATAKTTNTMNDTMALTDILLAELLPLESSETGGDPNTTTTPAPRNPPFDTEQEPFQIMQDVVLGFPLHTKQNETNNDPPMPTPTPDQPTPPPNDRPSPPGMLLQLIL